MKKRHIIALLFFLCFFGVAIRAMELFPKENISPKELPLKDRIILSLKEGKASIVENISEEKIDKNTIEQKIIIPTKEILYNTKENTVEKVDQVINKITSPVKKAKNSIAKNLISWIFSLLSPEDAKELIKDNFNIDICS